MPAKAVGKSGGTLYHQPLVHSLSLFITLPAVTDVSGGNQILEIILQGMKSDQQRQKQSVPELENNAWWCKLKKKVSSWGLFLLQVDFQSLFYLITHVVYTLSETELPLI